MLVLLLFQKLLHICCLSGLPIFDAGAAPDESIDWQDATAASIKHCEDSPPDVSHSEEQQLGELSLRQTYTQTYNCGSSCAHATCSDTVHNAGSPDVAQPASLLQAASSPTSPPHTDLVPASAPASATLADSVDTASTGKPLERSGTPAVTHCHVDPQATVEVSSQAAGYGTGTPLHSALQLPTGSAQTSSKQLQLPNKVAEAAAASNTPVQEALVGPAISDAYTADAEAIPAAAVPKAAAYSDASVSVSEPDDAAAAALAIAESSPLQEQCSLLMPGMSPSTALGSHASNSAVAEGPKTSRSADSESLLSARSLVIGSSVAAAALGIAPDNLIPPQLRPQSSQQQPAFLSSPHLDSALDRSISESAILLVAHSEAHAAPAQPKRRSFLSRLRHSKASQGTAEGSALPLGRTASDTSLLSRQSSASIGNLQDPGKRTSLLGRLRRGSSSSSGHAVAALGPSMVISSSDTAVSAPEASRTLSKSSDCIGAAADMLAIEEQQASSQAQALAGTEPPASVTFSGGSLPDQTADLQLQSAPASPRGRAVTVSGGAALQPDVTLGRAVSNPNMLQRLSSGTAAYSNPATPRRTSLLGRLSRGRRSNSIAPEPNIAEQVGSALNTMPVQEPFAEQPFAEQPLTEQPSAEQPYIEGSAAEEIAEHLSKADGQNSRQPDGELPLSEGPPQEAQRSSSILEPDSSASERSQGSGSGYVPASADQALESEQLASQGHTEEPLEAVQSLAVQPLDSAVHAAPPCPHHIAAELGSAELSPRPSISLEGEIAMPFLMGRSWANRGSCVHACAYTVLCNSPALCARSSIGLVVSHSCLCLHRHVLVL